MPDSRTDTTHTPLVFEPVNLDGRQRYLDYLAKSPQTASDYSFVNVWAWAEEYGLEWAFGRTHVWLRQTRPETVYWAPVGPWRDVDWAHYLCMAGPCDFIRVPETLVRVWLAALGDRVRPMADRDHWDYVYRVGDLADLTSPRLRSKRDLLERFRLENDYEYHPMTMDCVEVAEEMQGRWLKWRDSESRAVLDAENNAIHRVLTHWDDLPGLFGGVIEIDGVQAAYAVAEALTPDTVVIHFEKGHTRYEGIYQAINQMFLDGQARRFTLVNREQDLGDPGLRKSKLSYDPALFIKKYRVTLT